MLTRSRSSRLGIQVPVAGNGGVVAHPPPHHSNDELMMNVDGQHDGSTVAPRPQQTAAFSPPVRRIEGADRLHKHQEEEEHYHQHPHRSSSPNSLMTTAPPAAATPVVGLRLSLDPSSSRRRKDTLNQYQSLATRGKWRQIASSVVQQQIAMTQGKRDSTTIGRKKLSLLAPLAHKTPSTSASLQLVSELQEYFAPPSSSNDTLGKENRREMLSSHRDCKKKKRGRGRGLQSDDHDEEDVNDDDDEVGSVPLPLKKKRRSSSGETQLRKKKREAEEEESQKKKKRSLEIQRLNLLRQQHERRLALLCGSKNSKKKETTSSGSGGGTPQEEEAAFLACLDRSDADQSALLHIVDMIDTQLSKAKAPSSSSGRLVLSLSHTVRRKKRRQGGDDEEEENDTAVDDFTYVEKSFTASCSNKNNSSKSNEHNEHDNNNDLLPLPAQQQQQQQPCSHTNHITATTSSIEAILKPLMPFQREGTLWMARTALEPPRMNIILADEMGLGKTVQTICFIQLLDPFVQQQQPQQPPEEGKKGKKKKSTANTNGGAFQQQRRRLQRPHLIVAPLSTLPNWKAELDRFAPGVFRVGVLDGSREDRNEEMKAVLCGEIDLLLVSHDHLSRRLNPIQGKILKMDWGVVVVDEAHRLKNQDCKLFGQMSRIPSVARIALTGTPLQNNVMELFSLLHYILPKGSLLTKENRDLIDILDWALKRAKSLTRFLDEELEILLCRRIHRLLAPFILRRERTEVLSQLLPDKDEYQLMCPLQPLQEALLHEIETKKQKGEYVKNAVLNSRKILLHPYVLEWQYYLNEALVKASGKLLVLDKILSFLHHCNHQEEIDVADENGGGVATTTSAMNIERAKTVDEQEEDEEEGRVSVPLPPPTAASIDASPPIPERGQQGTKTTGRRKVHKTLIFCLWTQVLDVLDAYCCYRGWKFVRLDGRTPSEEREANIQRFNEDPTVEVFLISKIAGGVGLNLQVADTVILYDSDYNPQKDLQALSRVYRVGQQHHVKVFSLVSPHHVEGRIQGISKMKLEVSDKVISAGRYGLAGRQEEEGNGFFLIEGRRNDTDNIIEDGGDAIGEGAAVFNMMKKEDNNDDEHDGTVVEEMKLKMNQPEEEEEDEGEGSRSDDDGGGDGLDGSDDTPQNDDDRDDSSGGTDWRAQLIKALPRSEKESRAAVDFFSS